MQGFYPKRAIVMARRATPAQKSSELDSSGHLFESLQTEHPQNSSVHQETMEPVQANREFESSYVGLTTAPPLDSLQAIASELQGCTRCKLCQKRTHVVVGEGNSQAKLVFVGEGPGEQEDLQGRPFVGKAGQLLDKMIAAIGLQRDQVYIANVVKCRPPGNRNPEPDEIAACSPFLYRQLDLIQPQVVVALGKFAAQTLLNTDERITSLRGRFHSYRGAKLMPTFHPSYLLRNPSAKREAWSDLKQVAQELGLSIPSLMKNRG